MSKKEKKVWWEELPASVGGDVIVGEVGAGARGVAIGKNITQMVYDVVGKPTVDDAQVIEQKFAELSASLQKMQDQLDPKIAEMAESQITRLKGELTKTEEDEKPSANTITKVGDWLLDNIPAIAEVLASLFATPAVGKVVAKAGEVVVRWIKQRFRSNER